VVGDWAAVAGVTAVVVEGAAAGCRRYRSAPGLDPDAGSVLKIFLKDQQQDLHHTLHYLFFEGRAFHLL